jgi:hypothetical protein
MANTRQYELSAGLVLPGIFGAELVFLFTTLTRDIATGFNEHPWPWMLLRYALGVWLVLYVCTSFVVTVTHVRKDEYGAWRLGIDSGEAFVSFVALAFLGFVDPAVKDCQMQADTPLGVTFLVIAIIAGTGVLHGHEANSEVTIARWVGFCAAGVALIILVLNKYAYSFLSETGVFWVAGVATFVCYLALVFYFIGRWKKEDARPLANAIA